MVWRIVSRYRSRQGLAACWDAELIIGFLIFFPIYGWLTKYLLLVILWLLGGVVFLFAFILLSLASWVAGGAALVQCYHVWHGAKAAKDIKGIMRS
jgi:hypothetical protein